MIGNFLIVDFEKRKKLSQNLDSRKTAQRLGLHEMSIMISIDSGVKMESIKESKNRTSLQMKTEWRARRIKCFRSKSLNRSCTAVVH